MKHILRAPIPLSVVPDFLVRRRVQHAANVEVRAAVTRFGVESPQRYAAIEKRAAAAQFTELLLKGKP